MNAAALNLPRWLFRLLAAAVLLISLCGAGSTADLPVTVYYFHSTLRCADCLEIERVAGEVLRQTFAQELDDGQLLWQPVNSDLPENTHFVFDFDLAANELVVVGRRQGLINGWAKVPAVWSLVHEPESLRATLIQLVRRALAVANGP